MGKHAYMKTKQNQPQTKAKTRETETMYFFLKMQSTNKTAWAMTNTLCR